MRVLVYGLGLIGGSLGLALRKNMPSAEVTAVDHPEVLALPQAASAAHELVDCTDPAAVDAALGTAKLAVLAVPVGAITGLLPSVLARAAAVTDCGSTKRAICRVAATQPQAGRFVPGHPMAGLPEGGLPNARPDLFEGRTWILCPENSEPDALTRVEALIASVGAQVAMMSPEAHDRAVARTSHLPQILASALAVLGAPAHAAGAAGPAFERATHTAGGAEAMWRDIFTTNADEIAAALAELEARLGASRQALSKRPPELEPLLSLLAEARRQRAQG